MLKIIKRILIVLFSLIVLLTFSLYNGWIDISETLRKYEINIVWECESIPENITYWQATSQDELSELLSINSPDDGNSWSAGKTITISTLKPTTFKWAHVIGHKWLILQTKCDQNMKVWRSVVPIDEEVILAGEVKIPCPCGLNSESQEFWREVK